MSDAVALKEYQQIHQQQQLADSKLVWLNDYRKLALEKFIEQGFPGSRLEDWKYTDLSRLNKQIYQPAVENKQINKQHLENYLLDENSVNQLVFVNGHFNEQLSQFEQSEKQLTISTLQNAITKNEKMVAKHFAQQNQDAGISQINSAFMQDGLFLHIAKEHQVEKPLHLLFVHQHTEDHSMSHSRNLIIAEPGSKACIIEQHIGLCETDYLSTIVTEIVAEANSQVEFYKVQQEGKKANHVAQIKITQQRDSQVICHNFDFGGKLVRNDLHAELQAENSHCILNGLYLLNARQHVDNHTRVDHLQPQTTSHEFYKGIIDDRARGVFNGKVIVHQDAQKINAHQQNHNLLLSDKAEIDTKPQLEIFADDVKCSHGATIGQLDDNAIFYLQSRGISLDVAKDVLTYGFAHEVISRVSLDELQDKLNQTLLAQLACGKQIEGYIR